MLYSFTVTFPWFLSLWAFRATPDQPDDIHVIDSKLSLWKASLGIFWLMNKIRKLSYVGLFISIFIRQIIVISVHSLRDRIRYILMIIARDTTNIYGKYWSFSVTFLSPYSAAWCRVSKCVDRLFVGIKYWSFWVIWFEHCSLCSSRKNLCRGRVVVVEEICKPPDQPKTLYRSE